MFYDFMHLSLSLLNLPSPLYSYIASLKFPVSSYFFFLTYNSFFRLNLGVSFLTKVFELLNFWVFYKTTVFAVKKNYPFYVKLFHLNRNKTRFNKLLVFRKFRFNFFWSLSSYFKRKICRKTTNFTFFLPYHSFRFRFLPLYFANYSAKLFKFWFFLAGGLISPFNWETIPAKLWSFKNLNFSLNLNRKKKKDVYKKLYLGVSKDTQKRKLIKKLLINNFFYFTQTKIRNLELKYRLRLLFDKTKKNAFDYALIKPYYFLSNPYGNFTNFKFNNFTTLAMYKSHRRIFSFLRKNNLRNKIWFDLWYKEMHPFFKHDCNKFWFKRLLNKHFIRPLPNKIKNSFKALNYGLKNYGLKFRFLKKKMLSAFRKKKIRKLFFKTNWLRFLREKKNTSRRRLMRARLRYATFFFYEKNLRKFTLKKKKKFFLQKRRNCRVTLFGALKRVRRFYIPKINRFFLWNLLLKSKFFKLKLPFKFFRIKKTTFSFKLTFLIKKLIKQSVQSYFFYQQPLSPSRSLLISNNIYHHEILKSFDWNRFRIKSYVFSFVKLPVLWSKHMVNFISKPHAFLHLASNTVLSSDACHYEKIYLQRKFLYSFSVKSDIYKYVMRRYVKTKVFSNFSKDFAHYSNVSFYDSVEEDVNTSASYDFNVKPLVDSYLPSLQTLSSFRSFFSNTYNSKDWQDLRGSAEAYNLINHTNNILNIRRIKLKPGYMSIWRRARVALQNSMSLKFRYQHRLTRYLNKYKKFIGRKFLFVFEMRLQNILIKSRLVPEVSSIFLLLESGLVFINGVRNCNPNFQVYSNDFIQLIISYKYYIYYKWLLNWSRRRRLKLRLRTKKKLATVNHNNEKKRTSHYPEWLLNSKRSIEDVAKFLEVDFFTLSIFVIYEPFLSSDLNPYSIVGIRYGVINLYNWKYIT